MKFHRNDDSIDDNSKSFRQHYENNNESDIFLWTRQQIWDEDVTDKSDDENSTLSLK